MATQVRTCIWTIHREELLISLGETRSTFRPWASACLRKESETVSFAYLENDLFRPRSSPPNPLLRDGQANKDSDGIPSELNMSFAVNLRTTWRARREPWDAVTSLRRGKTGIKDHCRTKQQSNPCRACVMDVKKANQGHVQLDISLRQGRDGACLDNTTMCQ